MTSGAAPERDELFIDTGFAKCSCRGEKACGDTVLFKRIPEEERLIAVLADGLGHGVKAEILSAMTATMALRFVAEDREIVHSAEIIMDALPVCKVRKISYSTFTIIDTRPGGITRVVEMDNPQFILFRAGKVLELEKQVIFSPKYRDRRINIYSFQARPDDKVIFFSDGVTQAGMGSPRFPLGWRGEGVREYLSELLSRKKDISAQEISENLMREAIAHETDMKPGDDISAGCLSFRQAHRMLLFTGPPYDSGRDRECAEIFRSFSGSKVICGGTSAEIISRELGRELKLDLDSFNGDLPPVSYMDGADLVTEGIFTLSRATKYLENGEIGHDDGAGMLADLLRRNDVIDFLVGTRVNEAHQDPNLPVDLELRRNIVKRLAGILRERYLKEVNIRFV